MSLDLRQGRLPEPWGSWDVPSNLIVGESNYSGALSGLLGKWAYDFNDVIFLTPVVFERQPSNPYDSNAIQALVLGRKVGHLPSVIAAKLSPVMDRQGVKEFEAPGVIHGFTLGDGQRGFACHFWPMKIQVDWLQDFFYECFEYRLKVWPPRESYRVLDKPGEGYPDDNKVPELPVPTASRSSFPTKEELDAAMAEQRARDAVLKSWLGIGCCFVLAASTLGLTWVLAR